MEQLLLRLKDPCFFDGHEIFTSASIGVSLYPRHGADYEVLCSHADSAMYQIKSLSTGGCRTFEPEFGHAAAGRMKRKQQLPRLAIRNRQPCCTFRPTFDFRAQRVVGIETLLRWRDEDGIIQPPGNFAKHAVELGLMDEVTHNLLAEIVENIAPVDETCGRTATISINIAVKQAGDIGFMRGFAESPGQTGFASRFMVELTEEAFLVRGTVQSRVLPMLRAVGAKVPIDDFGVGSSSLVALADITADEIKVDRCFITAIHRRPRSQSILKAIESLGLAPGMSVIVEGVESAGELADLAGATQIRLAQGYCFGRPEALDTVPVQADAVGGRWMPPACERPASRRRRPRGGGRRG